jgi:hypothetical protein
LDGEGGHYLALLGLPADPLPCSVCPLDLGAMGAFATVK